MYTAEERDVIVLSAFGELSYAARVQALSCLASPEPDFSAVKDFLIKSGSDGVYNKVKEKFHDPAFRETVFGGLKKRGVECVTYFSEDYPRLLKDTDRPPVVLYLKGNKDLLKGDHISIVGSRRTSENVLSACARFSGELSKRFTVVTGSADGADAAALKGADFRAISVLAYGFDWTERSAEASMLSKVAKEGLLVSEFSPETQPKRYYFPIRNRIIAGLSRATLVVSAGKKSGALITAGYAEEYSREVFAFPYGIGFSSGEGCNELIKKGARLTTEPLDIFSFFGVDLKPSPVPSLTEEEGRILELVREAGQAFLPEIAEKAGVPPYVLTPVMTSLEIKGCVTRLGGNRFAAVK